MRVRSAPKLGKYRYSSGAQRAQLQYNLQDLPANIPARPLSDSIVYKWRVIIYRNPRKGCDSQLFMSLTEATKYMLDEEHASATPIRRIYLEAVNP